MKKCFKKDWCYCYADNLMFAQEGLITVMSFSSPPRVPSNTSVVLFTTGTRWWMDRLI